MAACVLGNVAQLCGEANRAICLHVERNYGAQPEEMFVMFLLCIYSPSCNFSTKVLYLKHVSSNAVSNDLHSLLQHLSAGSSITYSVVRAGVLQST